MDFAGVPVDGSSKIDDSLMESLEPFDLSQAVDFKTAYLAGYLADKYDMSSQDCIERANERAENAFRHNTWLQYLYSRAYNGRFQGRARQICAAARLAA